MPVLSLTKHDCDTLLSITLQAFLPKIHINRNTSRTIVHGPFSRGSLAIPHIHTVQDIDKLHLFLGHLRLHDDTGILIHIDLTYVQLILGMPTLFLNLDPNKFIWMDKGWLTSLWEFIYAADLQIHYPEQWLPTQSRENVIFLMEWLLTKNLKANEIRLLNSCRLYLQVVTLSDIVSANGLYILPEIKAGKTLADRQSNWDWPIQGRPTTVAWSLWNDQLSSLEHKGKLKVPLGRWIN